MTIRYKISSVCSLFQLKSNVIERYEKKPNIKEFQLK